MALINSERPMSFNEVKGQDEIIRALSNDLAKENIKGAYLFSGIRGTGKTTLARIFARGLNCEHPKEDGSPCNSCKACREILNRFSIDIYELDAASHNSVEDVREIIQKVAYKPLNNYIVVIMDEVHMLSQSAFNALLKTLEEPPENVVFILCTTEKHKVPATIISRCSCHTFKKISFNVIAEHLRDVINKANAKGEQIDYEETALAMIAKAANGGMRDALSILDNFFTMNYISADAVAAHLGISGDDVIFTILTGIAQKNPVISVEAVKAASEKGISFSFLVKRIFEILLDLVEFQSTGDCDAIIGTESYQNSVHELAVQISTSKVFQILDEFRKIYQLSTDSPELSIISAILGIIYQNNSIDELNSKIEQLQSEIQVLKNCRFSAASDVPSEPASSETCLKEMTPDCKKEHAESTNLSMEDYYKNMAENYDASFPYEEEQPYFSGTDSANHPVSHKTADGSASSQEQHRSSVIPDGISFEELEELDYKPTLESPFPETNSSDIPDEHTSTPEEEIPFFGDLFSEFARQL